MPHADINYLLKLPPAFIFDGTLFMYLYSNILMHFHDMGFMVRVYSHVFIF